MKTEYKYKRNMSPYYYAMYCGNRELAKKIDAKKQRLQKLSIQ